MDPIRNKFDKAIENGHMYVSMKFKLISIRNVDIMNFMNFANAKGYDFPGFLDFFISRQQTRSAYLSDQVLSRYHAARVMHYRPCTATKVCYVKRIAQKALKKTLLVRSVFLVI